MKDQITALMEALRLSRLELDRHRWGSQSSMTTIDNIEQILRKPAIGRAINTIGPLVGVPSIVPDEEVLVV